MLLFHYYKKPGPDLVNLSPGSLDMDFGIRYTVIFLIV